MDSLERYINQLFARYPKTQANLEARDEILSNLRARIADDLSHGLSEKEAIANAKNSIPSLDFLDSKQRLTVSTRAFALNILQHVLLCLSVAWIVSLPFRMFHTSGRILNTAYLLMIIAAGFSIFWLAYYLHRRLRGYPSAPFKRHPAGFVFSLPCFFSLIWPW